MQKFSIDEIISEASTQLYAREKYVKILSHYGVEPVNHENIKKNGLGYQASCNLIRDFFTKDGEMQVGELINIANGSQSGQRIVENKLKNKGFSEEKIQLPLNRWDCGSSPHSHQVKYVKVLLSENFTYVYNMDGTPKEFNQRKLNSFGVLKDNRSSYTPSCAGLFATGCTFTSS